MRYLLVKEFEAECQSIEGGNYEIVVRQKWDGRIAETIHKPTMVEAFAALYHKTGYKFADYSE